MVPLALAALALAGFNRAPVLEPVASYVAHKPVVVYCAATNDSWLSALQERGYPAGVNVVAFADPPNGTEYIGHSVCMRLVAGIRRQASGSVIRQADDRLTLVHESLHVRGMIDEGQTECEAMHELPGVVVRFFGVKPGTRLRAFMAAAWMAHRLKPPTYTSVC